MVQVDAVIELLGESGPVTVRSDDFPVRLESSRRRYPYPDFGADLIDRLFRALPTASRAGPPWARRTVCSRCRSDRIEHADAELTLRIDVGRVAPFHLTYRLPAVRCSSCGLEQARPGRDLEFHVPEALADGLDAADVTPG